MKNPQDLKILLYVLCYNDETELSIRQNLPTNMRSICKIIRLPEKNKYLEFYMYTDYLLQNQEEWKNKDFVGTLSWCFPKKLGMLNIDIIRKKIIRFNPEIFTFYNFSFDFFSSAQRAHPKFLPAWKNLLSKMGFTSQQILEPKIPCFFCNYWMAKPKLMERYISFAQKVKETIEKNEPDLVRDLYADSGYRGRLSKEELINIFGVSHYPMLNFVCERLICFFVRHYRCKRMY